MSVFSELIRVRDRLGAAAAARMTEIGIDLIIAGLSERLAREVPQPVNGSVVVQRAKAHLESAARRLADPACAHLSIGLLAYGCGFAGQAHFVRRFKERHGAAPRAYRQAALVGVP
ncbi:hypothetical protein MCBMB27_03345 [Methylobacterium phyllosphaerae]|uniref:Helix-turn-helix domain-containing protein n=1 Tax=Methylobacterium phyllosphaerae TaxID=418223 RepID=A0AAE8HUL0_9HYPH|nr:helix-turn-helix domain-containing protein [Methylobacterium phyllosphaerae]APT32636.1 hypothetical protein MCBMB27_03345 [Methylobacterium phyllosphaerae]SFH27584.1 Helix-turn-helix domain-containing protein [Methylobacterium phyllosphaerae]